MAHAPIRILGIDPGLRNTGWGLIEALGTRLSFVDCGTVHSDGDLHLADRLRQLHEGIAAVIHALRPDEVAIEETFVNKDARATLKLGQARGVAMLAPAQAGLPVAEYAPNLVKKTIVGAGHAEKDQIHMMVRVLLPKADPRTTDAADALAIALTHAQHRGARALERDLLARVR
ncbi:crossover junction endodeoxyribonuclease RuvC [Alsobacter sp. SYSU M60028]|uniref:Crossover junction endodeoxyribonuclease RuvC n=1 Tax=Alsobacter ponti TaxID=2962936 RepID=A0ABT1LFT5_9HYPH|nr:crossover junction endodeoxyribonuclease RuvC [Alsobacter ponti]MCP8939816.1 crossover junction endodeoxyribonuclease RuvC [Alsobacter ponti]